MGVLPDTSAVIEGVISDLLRKGKIRGPIVIHRAVVSELNHQANQGKITGMLGLEEIKEIRKIGKTLGVKVEIVGDYPTKREIELAKMGEIDLLLIEYAFNNNLTLITSDTVQAKTAEAMGVRVFYIEPKVIRTLEFEKYFDEETMSVHLKENTYPTAKKGTPKKWRFVKISDEIISKEYLEKLSYDIIEFAKQDPLSFVEIDRKTTTIVQLRSYRIIICRPPFSSGWEITIVRPIKKLSLQDYNLPRKLLERLEKKAEGILIAGPPGAGKCVTGDTLILTELGKIPAADLYQMVKNGKSIRVISVRMNRIEKQKIKKAFSRKAKIIIKITTSGGRTIKVTPAHPLLLGKSSGVGWYRASQANEGDMIATFGEDEFIPAHPLIANLVGNTGGKFIEKSFLRSKLEEMPLKDLVKNKDKLLLLNSLIRWETIKKIERYETEEFVYDFECERVHNFIANGVIIHNSTFAQALAEFYASKGKIVKTVESPRDLSLPAEITQYSKDYGDSKEIHDILLLSRPDYTIFDEMRDDDDFKLYIDMRLAGVGMVGVIHASSPIDAIQRFIRRAELGQIPSIIDTTIFIEGGEVSKVYSLNLTVKLPTGLKDRELTRPVIEVRNFLTNELEYEIYKFGEETVVVPVRRLKSEALWRLMEEFGIKEWEERNGRIIIKVNRDELKRVRKSLRRLSRILKKRFKREIIVEVV